MGGFGFPPAETVEYRVPEAARPIFELRPLSVGEILDRTFTLYRQRFWLYVGLSSVAAAVTTLVTFAQLSLGLKGLTPAPGADPAVAVGFLGKVMAGLFVVSLINLVVYSFTRAAAVSAVEANYLGQETTIGESFRVVRGKWYRYALVALWQGWSFVWPMMALLIPAIFIAVVLMAAGGGGGAAVRIVGLVMLLLLVPAVVVGFIFYLRNSLGIVACVSEKLGVRAAMRRSKALVADYKTRAFLLYLLLLVLGLAVGTVQYFFKFFLDTAHGPRRVGLEVMTLLVTFVSGALVQPVGAIAFVLFYIDQRVRKEGYDVEMLLANVTGVPPPPRELASPFGSVLPGESVFGGAPLAGSAPPPTVGSGFGFGAGGSVAGRPVGDSPFSSGPLPGSVAPAPPVGDSLFSSPPLPGSTEAGSHE